MHQDTIQTSDPASPRFRPYSSPNHQVTKGRYITSNDARGYIPVYEYPLNGQWIMMDIDDGYVLWTGIWKALGHSKADIVKMVDSQPDLAPLIRRVRGGYLKIQGTWMPYEVALRLSRRVAWPIRDDLVPLFGPTFPSTCLSPDQPGFGQVVPSGPRRRARRNMQTLSRVSTEQYGTWNVMTKAHDQDVFDQRAPIYSAFPPTHSASFVDYQPPATASSQPSDHDSVPPPRFTPYPSRSSPSSFSSRSGHREPSPAARHPSPSAPSNNIVLAPIQSEPSQYFLPSAAAAFALPPISALEDLRGISANDSAAVLRRLKSNSDEGFLSRPDMDRQFDLRDREHWQPVHSFVSAGQRRVHQPIHLSIPSSSSSSSNSNSTNPSPISPATPQSSSLFYEGPAKFSDLGLVPLPVLEQMREQQSLSHPRAAEMGYPHDRQPIRPW